jgi:hypothetical protein
MRRSLAALIASSLAALALFGCPKENPSPDKGAPSASASAVAPTNASGSAAALTSSAKPLASGKAAPSRERKPLTEEEKTKRKSYHAGLAAGRKATIDKDYPAAIKGFDEALAAKPDDPRALSERGYAKLLARDFKSARADLDKSARGTTDKKLLASIWFNQGLISESLGENASAQMYFARSNALNPTKAAQAKLEGKSKCPATLAKDEVKGSFVASWRDAWTAMGVAYAKEFSPDAVEEKPKSDDEVKKLVCDGGDCKGAGPWVVSYGGPLSGVRFLAAPAGGGKLAIVPLGTYMYPMCGGDYVSELSSGALTHLKSVETVHIRGWLKEVKGELVPCDENDPPESCVSACAAAETTETHAFFDLAKPAVVLSVSTDQDAAHAPLVTVKESNGTVTVNGAGCSDSIKLK